MARSNRFHAPEVFGQIKRNWNGFSDSGGPLRRRRTHKDPHRLGWSVCLEGPDANERLAAEARRTVTPSGSGGRPTRLGRS